MQEEHEKRVQLQKSVLAGKSVVVYFTDGSQSYTSSPDFYFIDITYQDDEYTVPKSIQLATEEQTDIVYLTRTERVYEQGLGGETAKDLLNTKRFDVDYIEVNGIKVESDDLTTIKKLLQAPSSFSAEVVQKIRSEKNQMKLVDTAEKVDESAYKKKKKKSSVNKSLLEKLLNLFEVDEMDQYEYVLDDEQDISKSKTTTIIKQLEEEQMIAIEPLYIKPYDVDAHGDSITEEELYKMVDNFNKNIENIKGNIHHRMFTDAFKPLRAFVAPADMYIGDIEKREDMVLVPKGQPIVEVQFAKTEDGIKLWKDRKAGIVRGVSIGAQGVRVPNPEYSEEEDE